MIQKETYGFNSFAAVHIGEIQEKTDKTNWYQVPGKLNIADWITRGRKAVALSQDNASQNGPDFLKLLEDEWPVHKESLAVEAPEQVRIVLAITKENEDNLAKRIDISRFSSYQRLLRVTARVLAMYDKSSKPSLKNVCKQLTAQDLEKAFMFWVQETQRLFQENFRNGKYKRLRVTMKDNGLLSTSSRAEKWMEMTHDHQELILLPHNHQFTRLYTEHIHSSYDYMGAGASRKFHLGISSTVSKIR